MTAEQIPNPNAAADWRPCQRGELSALVQRVGQARKREVRTRLTAAVSTAAMLLVLVGWMWQSSQPQPKQAMRAIPVEQRISCREVFDLADQYVRHELDDDLQARIAIHLKACPRCDIHVHNLAHEIESRVSEFSLRMWQIASR